MPISVHIVQGFINTTPAPSPELARSKTRRSIFADEPTTEVCLNCSVFNANVRLFKSLVADSKRHHTMFLMVLRSTKTMIITWAGLGLTVYASLYIFLNNHSVYCLTLCRTNGSNMHTFISHPHRKIYLTVSCKTLITSCKTLITSCKILITSSRASCNIFSPLSNRWWNCRQSAGSC